MRRWLAIAALSVALPTAPLFAQMHGGSRGAASAASMGHGGFSSSGFRGGAGISSAPHFGTSFGTGIRQPSFHSGPSFGGFRRPGFGPRHFGNRFFGGRFFGRTVFPGFFGYYGYPAYYGGDFYSAADYSPSYDYYGSSYYAAQNDIAQQQQDIDRLEDEVARLREQREAGRREEREPSDSQAESRPVVSTPTLLIFRDKHTQEVQNYAIVGGTLWIFSEQRATKLPLSWLDLEATTKANEDRGVDFQVPK
jgi:plasmid stabilization system protein ParE